MRAHRGWLGMSNQQTLRQRHGIARSHDIEQLGRRRSHVGEWTATPRTPAAAVAPKPLSYWDRFAAAAWRLHDGMPWVWALLGAVVLIASGAVSIALAAMAFGWSP